jgi:L-ascorbate metabolism protein UlaG (beta-lactamase superfamily)
MKIRIFLFVFVPFLISFTANKDDRVTKLLYQGHASFRIITKDEKVIYIDPYAGNGYDLPADIILVTHQHKDHNKVKLIRKKKDCVVITSKEALKGGKHNTFTIKGIGIEAVEASNRAHNPKKCAGYIITVDGIKLYHAGGTSETEQMKTFSSKKIDYALLPCDGTYNMNTKEASECAEIIGAKHNILMHTGPFKGIWPVTLFDREIAECFEGPNQLIIQLGEEITLMQPE